MQVETISIIEVTGEHKGRNLQLDIISSERNDLMEEVEKGLDPF